MQSEWLLGVTLFIKLPALKFKENEIATRGHSKTVWGWIIDNLHTKTLHSPLTISHAGPVDSQGVGRQCAIK